MYSLSHLPICCSQLLINAVTGEVGTGSNMSGNPTQSGICDAFAMPETQCTTSCADSCLAGRKSLILFALHQRNLRGELYIHHHADATIQLKKCGRAFSAQDLADYGHIL